jgi:hypothetical protein
MRTSRSDFAGYMGGGASRPLTGAHQIARRSDPSTSHAAAADMAPKLGKIQQQLLWAFKSESARNGLTPDEAEELAGLHVGARRRVSELHNAGLIEPTGEVRPGRAGKAQRVFRIARTKVVPTDLFGGVA